MVEAVRRYLASFGDFLNFDLKKKLLNLTNEGILDLHANRVGAVKDWP